MTADEFASRLDARQVAHKRWRGDCPVCGGTSRSKVSIGETDGGAVLVKCFGGCPTADVAHAVGLDLADLFPRVEWQSSGTHASRPRRLPRTDWPALIAACERDLLLVKIVLGAIGRHEAVSDDDAAACTTAATRVLTLIQEARHG